jgi:hypothetical protein
VNDVDHELHALSQDLDRHVEGRLPASFEEPGRSARGLVAAGIAVVAIVLGTAVLATTGGSGDLDVTTSPDTAPDVVPDLPTTTKTTTTLLPTPAPFVDPPVTDPRPLRLGVTIPEMHAKTAVERCVFTDGPTVCGMSVGPALKLGNWWQTFRLDPEDLTSRSVKIMRAGPFVAVPSAGGDGPPETVVSSGLEPVGPTVRVPGGEGRLAETSTDRKTVVGWTDPDGSTVWVEVTDTPRDDALALIAALRPRATYGFDLPDGTGLTPVLDVIDHQRQVPSEIRYSDGVWGITLTIFPGNRVDYESMVGSSIQVRKPPNDADGAWEGWMGTVRGRPAWITVSESWYTHNGADAVTVNYEAIWYEPDRGAVVSARIGTNAPDPDQYGLTLLDQLVELDEAAWQVMVEGTPQPQP